MTERPGGETCRLCVFWAPDFPHGGRSPSATWRRGQCRRHAPISGPEHTNSQTYLFPVIQSDGWCGDWQRAPDYLLKAEAAY
jgi:hypothetical protein